MHREIGEKVNMDIEKPLKRDRENEEEYKSLFGKMRKDEEQKLNELMEAKNKFKFKKNETAELIEKNVERIMKRESIPCYIHLNFF